ncbi:hypothetical protein CPB86DRAFT_326196 [Serendipita vermifera]|nr:hypothetical protein CPB86DRAFT_326196 [Serendipita vermifera]
MNPSDRPGSDLHQSEEFQDEYSPSSLDFSFTGSSETEISTQSLIDHLGTEGLPNWPHSLMPTSQPEMGSLHTDVPPIVPHDWESSRLISLLATSSGASYQPQPPQLRSDLATQEDSGIQNGWPWKWSQEDIETIRNEFQHQPWFSNGEVEPQLYREDPFVQAKWVTLKDISRFSCLFGYHQNRYHCRIPHLSDKGEACNDSWKKRKDALAHVRVYLGYKPYVCGGYRNTHAPCGQVFPTTQRRRDHCIKEGKKAQGPERKVPCPSCPVTVLKRNLERHIKTMH